MNRSGLRCVNAYINDGCHEWEWPGLKSAAEFALVLEGKVADVRLSDKAHSAYKEVQKGKDQRDVKRRTQLRRYLDQFGNNEPHSLSDQHYKKEGNFSDGVKGKVAIWTFKPYQWRLYGAVLTVEGKKCFVGVEVDPEKKQDKADKDRLAAAALAIGKIKEYIG